MTPKDRDGYGPATHLIHGQIPQRRPASQAGQAGEQAGQGHH